MFLKSRRRHFTIILCFAYHLTDCVHSSVIYRQPHSLHPVVRTSTEGRVWHRPLLYLRQPLLSTVVTFPLSDRLGIPSLFFPFSRKPSTDFGALQEAQNMTVLRVRRAATSGWLRGLKILSPCSTKYTNELSPLITSLFHGYFPG